MALQFKPSLAFKGAQRRLLGWKHSKMSAEQPTHAEAFKAILEGSNRERSWHSRARDLLSLKSLYVLTAIASFVCFAALGALNSVADECLVVDPDARCCSCISLSASQLDGQQMPTVRAYNDLFNGIATIINACFGTVFVIYAVRFENRYLLFCMVVTQFIEIVRCLMDVILDPERDAGIRSGVGAVRLVLVVAGSLFMFASWVLVRPVYKLFGWRIFRRGGARRSVRDMYKMFQRFRAMNLLDIQGSFVLFFVFVAYMDVARTDIWVFALLSVCEIMASRFLIKYLKREDLIGVLLTLVCKLVALVWWVIVATMYFSCYLRFSDSVRGTEEWWSLARVPDLQSVFSSYAGRECLASHTIHDARTLELVAQTLLEAVVFRLISTVFAILVSRNFNRGLRDLFYKKKRVASSAPDERMIEDSERTYEEDELDPYTGEHSDEERGPRAVSRPTPAGFTCNGPIEDE